LKAEIAWCSPAEVRHEFVAGFRIIRDEPDAVAAASEWVYTALSQADLVPATSAPRWTVQHATMAISA
jgi:hypothetical protein